MAQEAVLILPTQLFEQHPLITPDKQIFLVEWDWYFSAHTYHKQKLILHYATMRMYYDFLKEAGYRVQYIERIDADDCMQMIAKKGVGVLHVCDPIDMPVRHELEHSTKKHHIELHIADTPLFLTTQTELATYFAGKKQVRHHHFYQAQRKRLNILMTPKGKPVGGQWSFDTQNRQACPDGVHIPKLYTPRHDAYHNQAYKYVMRYFKNNPGNADTFWFPVTYVTAKKWLEDFLEHRLAQFGLYQDAMRDDERVLFHAVLSPLLNIGILTPAYVLERALLYADKHTISIANLEGFVRQLIGWREYVRGVYVYFGDKQRKSNFFAHQAKLPKGYWDGTTGILPVDDAIKKTITYAYTHHIERLMILGNSMLLQQVHPTHVYDWFMQFYIDAYDWVMVPNVYGMSQYADGGLSTTKPYISGSGYVIRMSNYPKGAWTSRWDALYWNFVHTHRARLAKNPRLAIMAAMLKRMKPETLSAYIDQATTYMKERV